LVLRVLKTGQMIYIKVIDIFMKPHLSSIIILLP